MKSFLQCAAATVRTLVRAGKAAHVTEATAQELDLLAGLPWEHASDGGIPCALKTPKIEERCHWCRTRDRVIPADLALGWLLASKCDISKDPGKLTHWWEAELHPKVRRAAECAELATLSMCLAVKDAGRDCVCNPHDGTRDGAKEAWGFIVEKLNYSAETIEDNTRKPDRNVERHTGKLQELADYYRRELEAM